MADANIAPTSGLYINDNIATIVASSDNPGPYTYTWYEDGVLMPDSTDTITPSYSEASHEYYCFITWSGGSGNTPTATITWSGVQIDGITFAVYYTTVTASPTQSGSFSNYSWRSYEYPEMTGSPTVLQSGASNTFSPTVSGYYAVEVTDDNSNTLLSDIVEIVLVAPPCYELSCSPSGALTANTSFSSRIITALPDPTITIKSDLSIDWNDPYLQDYLVATLLAPSNVYLYFDITNANFNIANATFEWTIVYGQTYVYNTSCVYFAIPCSDMNATVDLAITDTDSGTVYNAEQVTIQTSGFNCVGA